MCNIGLVYTAIQSLRIFFPHFAIIQILIFDLGANFTLLGYMMISHLLIVTLAEVPAGILADKWSRKYVVIIGHMIMAGGFTVAFLSPNPWWFVLAWGLTGLGSACISGGLDAIAYETSRAQKKDWSKIKTQAGLVVSISGAFAALLGAFYYAQLQKWVFFFPVVSITLAALLVFLFLKDSPAKVHKALPKNIKGTLVLLSATTLPFAMFSLLLRQLYLVEEGFSVIGIGVVLAFFLVVGSFVTRILRKHLDEIKKYNAVLLIYGLQVVAILLLILLQNLWVLLGYAVLYGIFFFAKAWQSVTFNKMFPDKDRASLLSLQNLIYSSMVGIFALCSGYVLDIIGIVPFLVVLCICTVLLLVATLIFLKKDIAYTSPS